MPTISGDTGCSQVQAGSIQFDDVSAGMVIQVANYTTGAWATGTTITPLDDTIPQITEGTQFMSLAFTPKKTNSLLKIEVVCNYSVAVNSAYITTALFRDSGINAISANSAVSSSSSGALACSFNTFVSAVDIIPTTFTVRAGYNSAGTLGFNGSAGARLLGGSLASSITITEIAQ